VDEPDADGAFADGGRDSLDRAAADVADGEHAVHRETARRERVMTV
jgi:hypothetical protein